MKRIIVLAGALLAAQAQAEGMTLMVQGGYSGDSEMAGIGLRLAPFWSTRWGGFTAAAHPEFQLNRHRERHSEPGPDALWQAGGAAMLRAAYGEGGLRPYVEVGLGLNYLTGTGLGDRRYSTRLQFGEHLGAGIETPGGWFGGWRFSHYSNGGLRSPNNGLNAHQLVLGTRF